MHNNFHGSGSKKMFPNVGPEDIHIGQIKFLRYIDTKPNGEGLRISILSGPYVPSTVLVQAIAATEGVPAVQQHTTIKTMKSIPLLMLVKQRIMWIAIERLQQGESLNVQDVKTNLFWEFAKFTSRDGESMESYYSQFYKLMNELTRNNLTLVSKEKLLMCKQAELGLVHYKLSKRIGLADTDERVMNRNWTSFISFHGNDSGGLTKKNPVQTEQQDWIQIVQLILFIVDYGCTEHVTGNLKLLCNFVEKFLGTVHFGNDQQGLEFLLSPLLEEYYNLAHGHAEDNNNDQAPNASFQEAEFINPFCTGLKRNDQPLEQCRGNPTCQFKQDDTLATDKKNLKCCMFTLTVSIVNERTLRTQWLTLNRIEAMADVKTSSVRQGLKSGN
ncbi:hypothetical protein Tco_1405974 [Tanacetum coccineum]